jgi:subtilisin family serine protease
MSGRSLPAWSLPAASAEQLAVPAPWPGAPDREWALGGATGAGVRVCILDSGIEGGHPLVGEVASSVAVVMRDDEAVVVDDEPRDVCGHGTACAGVVRSIAPDCELHSVRVLGEGMAGSGEMILTGLRHAVAEGYDIVNLSLSTTKKRFAEMLHDLADHAYFQRTALVASAHNLPVESYPWRFSSVISVGSHEGDDPLAWYANPSPPVELFARGVDVEVAWLEGGTLRCSGNSFATPHIAGVAALILSKHPELTPFQLKSVLYATATNAGPAS